MPNINIKTKINKPAAEVFNRFSDGLFEKLVPPFATVKRNDGIKKGAIISVSFKIPFMKTWKSKIVTKGQDAEGFWFTDIGLSGMPFGIKTWKHTHRVKKDGENQCLIIDKIQFETGSKLLDAICLFIFKTDMKLRGKKYKSFFEIESK
jgi:ligand-binding SRPBCC domain-containing protein